MTAPDHLPHDSSMEKELYIGKEVAYYGAVVEAWVNTKMERDKSLLTLSGGGIALLGTVATTIGVRGTPQIAAISAGFAGFLVCAVAAVAAFHWNADYLAREIARTPGAPTAVTPTRLHVADWAMFGGFTVGLVGTVALGLLLALVPREGAGKSTDASPPPTGAPPPAACCACCCGTAPTGPTKRDSTARDSTVGTSPSRSLRPDSSSKARPRRPGRRQSERAGPRRTSADSGARRADPAAPAQPGRNACPPVRPLPADSGGVLPGA